MDIAWLLRGCVIVVTVVVVIVLGLFWLVVVGGHRFETLRGQSCQGHMARADEGSGKRHDRGCASETQRARAMQAALRAGAAVGHEHITG